MSSHFWRKTLTPSRLIAILGLAVIGCAALIANLSIDQDHGRESALRGARLLFVHEVVESADHAKSALAQFEITGQAADKDRFLRACDDIAVRVGRLRQAEHISEEQSDQIVDLCIAIRQQLSRLGSSPADRMDQAGYFLDRIRRVVLGFGMDEIRAQDNKLAEQSATAAMNRRVSISLAAIEILMVAGIVFLVVRLGRLEHLATVCAWSHRLMYEGQWISLERYLEQRFGVRASDGITTEQAAKIMADNAVNGQELVRLIEFEKIAGDRAKEASRAIHAVRNHLTAVLCYSEMAGSGDAEAQREMATRVLTHANTISSEVDLLHKVVRSFNPGPPDLRVVPKPAEPQQRVA
jgi:hypothetical protein